MHAVTSGWKPNMHTRGQKEQKDSRRDANTLCGGSNYVKWVVLITFLCLCGDYEHINQHDCQLEVSKPGRTRDGAEWVERSGEKTPQGIKFFLLSLLLCSITTTSKPKSKDSEECNESSLANIASLFQATHTNLLWPLCDTCVWTSTY